MTDPSDRFLEERLHRLAHGVRAPMVPPEEDVRRGRRRLLRMRVAMGGATTATLAVVLGITSLTAGDPKATEIPPATTPPTVLPATPDGSPPSNNGGGDDDRASGNQDASSGTQVRASGVGPGTRGAGGAVLPDRSQAENPTTGAATTGPQQHLVTPGGGPTGEPTTTPSGLPTEDPTASPTEPVSGTPTPIDPTTVPPPTEPPPTGRVRVDRVLAGYNAVLAEHLDPDRDHLQHYDRLVDPAVTRRENGLLYALGSTFRWRAGHSLSGLEITVATGWDQVDWECGATYSDWVCHVVDPATDRTEVATHDGVRQVAVEHSDGQVVVVTADPTYDALARAAGVDSGEAALVAAASDDRLVLPGPAAQAPPTIDGDAFSSAGRLALLTDGQAFVQTSLDRSPAVRGTWSAEGGGGGTLAWSARPSYSGEAFTCLATYRSCASVTVGDTVTPVHVAQLKKAAGGGWLVEYDGPSYAVRVYSSDRTIPKKLAYAFVTDDAWQPLRQT